MSNEIKKTEPNYFELYGDQVTPRTWLGDLMRFNKFGEYVAGAEAAKIAAGTKLIAIMPLLEVGWQCWRDSRSVDPRMGRIAEGFVPPRRAELGDLDKGQWEQFEDGREKDPWVFSNFLPMASNDGELFTFATSSKGGLGAVGELSKTYGKRIRQAPNESPIVKLAVGSYQHSNRAYGEIRFPIFDIVGWTRLPPAIAALIGEPTPDDDDSAAALAPPDEPVEPTPAKSKTKLRF